MPRAVQQKPQPRPGELPDEFKLRCLVAKQRLKLARAALSTYAASDNGRRNRDWRANNGSADLAIIPDSSTLNARARQIVRDTWAGKSCVRAFVRNVTDITVVPHAKDPNGKPLTKLNQVARRDFQRWAGSKSSDVERKNTFRQKQRLAAREKFTVGEHLWMWSYRMPLTSDGRIDRSQPVGLKLQSFEPEQFDLRLVSFEGHEVRGGVEVDNNGAPVAYHIYTRNPNDVLYRYAFFSERVAADRIFHYFEGERVLQSRGATEFAPVMQDVRDMGRVQNATMTRVMMEACIGVKVTSDMPVLNAMGGIQSTIPPAPGDSGQTDSGMTEADFVPGMVANLKPGEDLELVAPQSPGNQYDPFVTLTTRGIGAGVGMSYGQIMRHSDGNYSAARQDMLEDRKEWEPQHELLIDDLIKPTYELWFSFAAQEGRFDGVEGFDYDEFVNDRARFVEADFIPPPQTWIDPQKEATAFEVLLKNRLITREEIVAMRGGRFYEVVAKLAEERVATDAANLSLPENAEELTELRDLIKAMMTNRTGTIDSVAANAMDIQATLVKGGVPIRTGVEQPLLPVVATPGPLADGDPIKNSAGAIIGGGVAPSPPPVAASGAILGQEAPEPSKSPAGLSVAPVGQNAATSVVDSQVQAVNNQLQGLPVLPQPAPAGVPHYQAAADPAIACASCSFAKGVTCSRFAFVFDPKKRCDDWSAKTLTEEIGLPNSARTFPPGPQDGQRPLDDRFIPDADPRSGIDGDIRK